MTGCKSWKIKFRMLNLPSNILFFTDDGDDDECALHFLNAGVRHYELYRPL